MMATAAKTLVVCPADLEADRARILAALRRYLNPAADERRFLWLYQACPWGHARTWLAEEAETGEVVGICSAFPRRVQSGRAILTGWVLGDFCFAPEYRTLGPAMRLQRACLDEIDGRTVAFCYDFPSAAMTAVYGRLGVKPIGQVIRYAKPLRVDRKLRPVVGAGAARWLGSLASVSLVWQDRRRPQAGGLEMAAHEGPCGDEFTGLTAGTNGSGVVVQRTAEYLNWRYLASAGRRHDIHVARSRGRLRAYAVTTREGEDATLVDVIGDGERGVMEALVLDVADRLRRTGVMTLSAPISDAHPLGDLLPRLGFQPRERTPLIVYTGRRREPDAAELDTSRWSLTHGDRDS
jgi:hypothetical protein